MRKARPIIFTGESIKAILDGRKTMTRRVIRPPTDMKLSEFDFSKAWVDTSVLNWDYIHLPMKLIDEPDWSDDRWWRIFCPYGQVGDRLWVKESWYQDPGGGLWYRVDNNEWLQDHEKWKSSIFMPRWASRILLEITGIRVERVQEITEEDAMAEGFGSYFIGQDYQKATGNYPVFALGVFAWYWDFLNAKRGYSWESNPIVWVISFTSLVRKKVRNEFREIRGT